MTRKVNYDLFPAIDVPEKDGGCVQGWEAVCKELGEAVTAKPLARRILAIECYSGVCEDEILNELGEALAPDLVLRSTDGFKTEAEIDQMVAPFNGGDDPIFGCLTNLNMADYFATEELAHLQADVHAATGLVLVIGPGASLVVAGVDHLLVYADMPRWEAQMRMRRNEIANLGTRNHELKWSLQYKRAYFTDWRVCDRLKRKCMPTWDFVLDTTVPHEPRLASGEAVRQGLRTAAQRPFRVVPFFDPAPWGGQWMKEYCGLDPTPENYGWCFDCVPEENSLLLRFGEVTMELPSINLVFHQPTQLLGDKVHARFGDEFPIRFDFLDTIAGGNLSFQVHPLTEFIQNHFGMHYTQDESYYILDAKAGATVFLGLKDGVDSEEMMTDLEAAQRGEKAFDDLKFVNQFPAQKHDHFLIPAGTVHCSGTGSMVLEISATPYIFTFKMWDWGRLGLDGLPRPINLERGAANIQWDRTTDWVKKNLVNAVTEVGSGEGWREERTGLHEREFIETRRHWFTGIVPHHTQGGVNVLNLIEGQEAIVESPSDAFAPFVVHYAETFIVPACVGEYTIRPHGIAEGTECATIKAYVRT